MNNLYPIFLKLEHKHVLVVGGGKVSEQKIRNLLDANTNVTVIASEAVPSIENLSKEKKIVLFRRKYKDGDVAGFSIVIGATDEREVQERIFNEATAIGVPVNIVDMPQLCTFYLPSVFQEGDLKIAVSTNGKSPTLGKIVRDRIKENFSKGYPQLLERLGELRPNIRNEFPDFESRKKMYEQFAESELEKIGEKNKRQEKRLGRNGETGKVYLVGAGPGDPELIAVKGLKILRQAEVILYDALVNEEILGEALESAEKIFVGKRAGRHCVNQWEINDLLIRKAQEGKLVVRLKGGDPFIFGRGGEELEALRNAGVDVEVIPGITAGTGVPASLGIPLTYRNESSSVVFLTGHSAECRPVFGQEDSTRHREGDGWENLSHADTIVIYMGVRKLGLIIDRLIHNGVSPSKSIAVVFGGTSSTERVVVGTLLNIEDKIRNIHESQPGLIIVGEVVRFVERHKQDGLNRSLSSMSPEAVGAEIF